MGGMYPELVGAAGLRIESDADREGVFQKLVTGNGRFAVFMVDYLQGAVLIVGTKRKTDESGRRGQN